MKWRRTKKCCRIIWWCDVWNFLLVHLFFPICHWPVKSPPLCRKTKKKQWSLGPSIFIFGMTDYVNVYSSLLHPSRYIYISKRLPSRPVMPALDQKDRGPNISTFRPNVFFPISPLSHLLPNSAARKIPKNVQLLVLHQICNGVKGEVIGEFFFTTFKKKTWSVILV